MYEIMIEDRFAAAHQLAGYEGPCENIHGHTWKVQVFLKGQDLGKTGMLFDFKEAKIILKDILKDFDHKNLNEVRFFTKENPTAENIARTICEAFKNKLPKNIIMDKTTVWESEATCATYSL
jgi:6-pyruvoyltetrahydropterin/6-carboxytetrahydropterin synthase